MNQSITDANMSKSDLSSAFESFPFMSLSVSSTNPFFMESASISAAHFFSFTQSKNTIKPVSITAQTAIT